MQKFLGSLIGAGLGAALSLVGGCADVGFVGRTETEAKAILNSDIVHSSLNHGCDIISKRHPGIDPMVFTVKVSSADLRLDIPGRYEEAPQKIGEDFLFSGVNLPVGLNDRVSVGVFDSTSGLSDLSESSRFECETVAKELLFSSGDLSTDRSMGTLFKLTWENLYVGEELRFVSDQSKFSPDLIVRCEAEAVSSTIGTLPAEVKKLSSQNFNCSVEFNRPFNVKSIRYKNQRFVWDFLRDGQVVRSIDRPVTLDLILSAIPHGGADSPETEANLVDPETCQVMDGKFGQEFTHICNNGQSLLAPTESASLEACLNIQGRCQNQ